MQAIAPDVWRLDGAPLKLPLGVRLPLASTIMRLPDRSLLVYSPVRDTSEIATLGDVAHIVAPNLWHHLFAGAAKEQFPAARIYGAPGLAKKRTDLPIEEISAWDGIDVVRIDGAPSLNEVVLFHRASGTLCCGDLLFNIAQPANTMSKVMFSMTGVNGKLAKSRAWRFATKDKAALRASIERVLALPIKRLAPSHGDVIEIDAAALATKLRT